MPGLRAVDEGAVPASAPTTSRLFVLAVATRRWVLTDNSYRGSNKPHSLEDVIEGIIEILLLHASKVIEMYSTYSYLLFDNIIIYYC